MSRARDIADLGNEASGGLTSSDISAIQVIPHIIPGVLYPAISGKLLDGTTSHSGNYGTAQSDGRSYYYTDIKGSKPIKDPRIGGYFGSQRHKFKSVQLLEQETATHGKKVYSVDGREYIRASGDGDITILNNADSSNGQLTLPAGKNAYIEIVGYFSDVSVISYNNNNRDLRYTLDNATEDTTDYGSANQGSPLTGRYVDSGGLVNFGLGATLGIHTIKITSKESAENVYVYGIELIAQDTTSTANRSKIQIPSQDVVSYGKKFNVSGTPHYNPFATKGDGSASTIPNNTTGDSVSTGWAGSTSNHWDSSLDTATSLGLSAWESGGNYFRPVNGGRIIKWVDSSGAIKTSVNMMPPEAHQINATGTGTCDATGTTNWSSAYQPVFGNKRVGSDLITNGTFASDTAWTKESGITIGSGKIHMQGSSTHAFHQSVSGLVIGREYKATYTISEYSSGGARLYVDGGGGRAYHEANGTYSHSFIATATSHSVGLGGKSGVTDNLKVDDFSLYEIDPPEAQSEVAKTFYVREFGNGSANGNSTYADASTLSSNDEIAYVMDDGLTSFSSDAIEINSSHLSLTLYDPNDFIYITFIGTGITVSGDEFFGQRTIAQNLPYGSHILKIVRDSNGKSVYSLDGVSLLTSTETSYGEILEVTFHQNKKPPIPEEAVILSDYMLYADFVLQNTTVTLGEISKGGRLVSGSRDHFYNSPTAFHTTSKHNIGIPTGYYGAQSNVSSGAMTVEMPFFGTRFSSCLEQSNQADHGLELNGSAVTEVVHDCSADADGDLLSVADSSKASLGLNKAKTTVRVSAYRFSYSVFDSPIHTSSHYQSFETPFLHELVGGDRNMEQTNLVCSPDGRTWDSLTRNTSYLGNIRVHASEDGQNADPIILTDFRGAHQTNGNYYQKNFAIAYDRFICLKAGQYEIKFTTYNNTTSTHSIKINGTAIQSTAMGNTSYTVANATTADAVVSLKRGDYVQISGKWYNEQFSHFSITEV